MVRSKARRLPEEKLVARLMRLAPEADAIVMHPDTIVDPLWYRSLGRKLVLENMDGRKTSGRTADELQPLFDELPSAGFCFDIAHAWSIDPDMGLGGELLDAFGQRLRHLHISSLSPDSHHLPLSADDEARFHPLLARCLDVPWILEAPPRGD
jgi:sugar phosphate isomerase/epimerase